VDAQAAVVKEKNAGAERIARPALHHARGRELACDHVGLRLPLRPLLLVGHFVQASNAGARFANANASVEPPSTPGGRSPSGKAAWCRVFGRLSEGANGGVGRQYL
jgi:hypothetical protein